MQNSTSLKVLPLDKKIQNLNKNDVREKSPLKPNYSRDENLTDFGKATLLDRYLLPGEKFQDMMKTMQKEFTIIFQSYGLCRQRQFYQMGAPKEACQYPVF